MLDELKKDAEYYLGWNQRKLRYFKEQYENIKELKDERTMQLKCVFKSFQSYQSKQINPDMFSASVKGH